MLSSLSKKGVVLRSFSVPTDIWSRGFFLPKFAECLLRRRELKRFMTTTNSVPSFLWVRAIIRVIDDLPLPVFCDESYAEIRYLASLI